VTLTQFQDLKAWHSRHWQDQPMEKQLWDGVLTLWMIGWVGGPASLVLQQPAVAVVCLGLLFLPQRYVALRRRLMCRRRLRCDWLALLR
jgi:hypothetical protein